MQGRHARCDSLRCCFGRASHSPLHPHLRSVVVADHGSLDPQRIVEGSSCRLLEEEGIGVAAVVVEHCNDDVVAVDEPHFVGIWAALPPKLRYQH